MVGIAVSRVGLTPVKGGRHLTRESVRLTEQGPQGDRAFCLVDLEARRCLRTVENPTLLQTVATWDGTVLTVRMPSGTVSGRPRPTGETTKVDYWGRRAVVEPAAGPWADAYSKHLGRDVVLAASTPGEVVYGAPVTLVTSSSLSWLGDRIGSSIEGARFRATFELDTGDLPAFVEEGWLGRHLRIGEAELRVTGLVPRCAVIDLDPDTGTKDRNLLKALGAQRRHRGEVPLGVYADIAVPGQVRAGDQAILLP